MKVSSSIKLFSVGLLGMAYAGIASAEAVPAKVEIRGALVNSDNGLGKITDDVEVDSTMNIVPERAKLQWKGAAHSNVDVRARIDLLKMKG